MANNKDSVNVTVNNKEEEKKPAKKRGRPKKSAQATSSKPKKASIAEARTKSASTKKEEIEKAPKKNKKKGGIITTIISIILTALVVGTIIYAWQSRTGEKMVNTVRQEARNTRMDFEQRLEQLKNKISGIETENQKLKNTTKELEEKTKLLEGAKRDFSDPETGVSFEYPAVFGAVKFEMIEGEEGKKFAGTFENNEKLKFGGVSDDYVPKATTTEIDFLETQGFYERGDRYYFQAIGDNNSTVNEIIPTKIIGQDNREILVVNQNSFVAGNEEEEPAVGIGQNVGGLANLDNDDYPGISFINEDLGMLSMDQFEGMLNSLE